MRSNSSSFVLISFVLSTLGFVACKDAAKSDNASSSGAPSAAVSAAASAPGATSSLPSAAASASAGAPGALSGDGTGALALSWKVANAPQENVIVSAVVGDQTIEVGKLNAASDDGPGTIATCAMRNSTSTSSSLWCGGTPAYNYFTAKITGGALVFTKSTGVETGDEKASPAQVVEVTKRPTTATTLRSTGPASPALYGNCRPGYVQRSAEGVCMRQCLKGNECTGKDKCSLIAVKGTDGDHKVHACVPPGK